MPALSSARCTDAPHAAMRSSLSLHGVRRARPLTPERRRERHHSRATRCRGRFLLSDSWTQRSKRTALTKRYGKTVAVDGLSIAVRAGPRDRVRRTERRRQDDDDAAAARARRARTRETAIIAGKRYARHRAASDRRRRSARRRRRASRAVGEKSSRVDRAQQRPADEPSRPRAAPRRSLERQRLGAWAGSRSACGNASAWPPRCSAIRRS